MKQKFGGKLSYFISILSHIVAMTNFLHHPQKRDLVTELENANCQDKAVPLLKSEHALWTFNSFKNCS